MKRHGFTFLFALSGMVCLAVESIWIRWVGQYVGGSVVAATLVTCCFFFCAAAGSALAIQILPRVQKPLRAFALSEAVFAFSALLTVPVLAYFGPVLGGGNSPLRWALLTCLAIAVPSLAQGLSFPLITQAFVDSRSHRSVTGALFYAFNLAGAACGVILGGLLLPLHLGFQNTYFAFCLIGFCGAVLAWVLASGLQLKKPECCAADSETPPPVAMLLVVGMSGVLSIACELILLLWFRQLVASSLQSTVAVLFAFILSLGAGSLLVMLVRQRIHDVKKVLRVFLVLNALLLSMYGFVFSSQLGGDFVDPSGSLVWRTVGFCLKATLLLLPLGLCMGAIFPLSWELIQQKQHGRALALATVVNKCGCAIGAWAALFVFLPMVGLSRALLVCGFGYAFLLFFLAPFRASYRRVFLLLLVMGLIGAFQPDALFLQPGHQLLKTYKGHNQVVHVTENKGSRHIMVNQQYMLNGTAAALRWQKQESWIPLFFTPNPERVCYIGMASGIGASAILDLPVRELHTVELIPQVQQAARDCFSQWNHRLFNDARSKIIVNDGRHFIRNSKEPYDSIICTLFLPSREGSSDLYSQDFFREILSSLSTDGTFCIWLPAYQMDSELADSIIDTFRSVFSNAILLRGNWAPRQPIIGLFASPSPIRMDSEFLEKRIAAFKQQGLDSQTSFFRNASMSRLLLLGDLHARPNLFSENPINTDDAPFIAFHGDKTLRTGDRLRGLGLLRHFGKRFLEPEFPSCFLGETEASEVVNGIRSGNHAYAAAVASVPLPDADIEKIRQREQQVQQHMRTARQLSPAADLRREDLRQRRFQPWEK